MNTLNSSYNYNDLASLNAITKKGNEKGGEAEALKEVARQFESMFVKMMLKSMRDANAVFEEDNPLNSHESKFYRQMFDDQLALSMTKGKGIGLADSIYRQMAQEFKVAETGESGQPERSEPIRAFNVENQNPVNPFSTMKPNLDLMQFNQQKSVEPLNEFQKLQSSLQQKLENSSQSQSKLNEKPLDVEKLLNTVNAGSSTAPISASVSVPVSSSAISSSQAANEEVKPTTKNSVKPQVSEENDPVKPIKKSSGFTSPQDFVDTLWPIAQKVGKEMGVEPKAIISQAALETGWGKYIIHKGDGQNSHNLFGIKADNRWDGKVARVSTLEYRGGVAAKEVAPFRVYESYEHSLKDYAKFVSGSSRYENAVKNGESIQGYSQGLQNGGYATDPNYAQKIQRIASGDVLNDAIANSRLQSTGRG